MKISRQTLSMLIAGIGILIAGESSFAQFGGQTTGGFGSTTGSSGSSSSFGSTTGSFGGQTSSLSGSTLSSTGSTSGGTTTNSSSGRTTGSSTTGSTNSNTSTGTNANTGMVGANGSQSFVGGNASQSFVGGGRQQTGNSATSNRQFRGITDMQQVPGSNGQQSGTPRRIRTSLRVGFNVPTPSASAGNTSPSNLPSFDRFIAANPQLTGINVSVTPSGVAVITGATRSVETSRLAANLIRIQPGVLKVENQVEVTGEQ